MNKLSIKLRFAIASALCLIGFAFLINTQAAWWDERGLGWLAIVGGSILVILGVTIFVKINKESNSGNSNNSR